MRWLLAGLLIIAAAGCGSAAKTAHQPDLTPPRTIAATPTSATSPSPTTTQTVILETSSGLACYTDKVAHNLYEYGHGVSSEDDIEGLPTLEEAVSDWWDDRPDVFRNQENPLTQSPMGQSTVAFRDEHGNAQLLLYGEQASNGVWNIASAEFCWTPSNYIPR